MTYGERIKKLRTERGWSQQTLADAAGISKAFLCELEYNKRSMGSETLLGLATALEVRMHWLMTGDEEDLTPMADKRELPDELIEYASEKDLRMREMFLLLRVAEVLCGNRIKRRNYIESLQWERFHNAIKEWI
jgi:transcriptional regulator with XRE-family HTH domain